jgi:hypothetical protein
MEDKLINLNEAMAQVTAEGLTNPNRRHVTINHVDTANAAIKMIMSTPLHDKIKRIMIMRIGSPILKQKAMSHLAIALQLGMREGEVLRLEMEGVMIVRDYMDKVCMKDSMDKFNKEGKPNDVKNILT